MLNDVSNPPELVEIQGNSKKVEVVTMNPFDSADHTEEEDKSPHQEHRVEGEFEFEVEDLKSSPDRKHSKRSSIIEVNVIPDMPLHKKVEVPNGKKMIVQKASIDLNEDVDDEIDEKPSTIGTKKSMEISVKTSAPKTGSRLTTSRSSLSSNTSSTQSALRVRKTKFERSEKK